MVSMLAVEPEVSAADKAAQMIEDVKAEKVITAAVEESVRAAEFAAAPDAAEVAEAARLFAGTPVGFVAEKLGFNTSERGLYSWQAEVLTWFEDLTELVKGSVCTPNGAGKSAVIDAGLALWWISVHPQGRVVIISKDSKQLDNQLWPAIEAHKEKFPGYDFIERMVRNGRGGFIIGFTTDDPGRVEGWHKLDDFCGPLLIIADESKSISDPILMALDRCTYNAKLLTSSPGLTEGLFWKSQRADQAEPPIGYHHIRVGLKDCPHIPKSRIDNIIAEYGEDHWFTRSTLYGEFTDVDSDTLLVIPKAVIDKAMDDPPEYVPGGKRAFCDFAAGRNENVFTLRQGNRITWDAWKDPDPMRAVYEFVRRFVEHGLLPSEIKGDAGGLGIAVLARFAELGWPIIGVHNESEPRDPSRYPNKGAEQWHNAAFKLRGMILKKDEVAREQLRTRRAAPGKGGTMGLEPKDQMKARGAVSPDRGDGIVGVLDDDIDGSSTMFDESGLKKLEGGARGHVRPEVGKIDLGPQGAKYEQAVDGWLTVWEKPIVGHSYICVLNPHRFEESLISHSLLVVRSGFWDEKEGAGRPARLVAKVRLSPFRLDSGPLVEMVKKVSSWYGNCMVAPVVNDRGDIIERLLSGGVHTYAREDFEAQKHGRRDRALKFGWESDDYTRSMWMGALAEAIREDKIVVEDLGTVMQLYQLDGRQKQMRDAEALGVGIQLGNYATTYAAPERKFQFGAREEDLIASDSMFG
jgi:phage terminase large subunit